MSCHTRSYSKRLLFQISPLHYIGQQSYCRSTPSLCSTYPIHDRTNGYNGSLWFYQIWDTYFQLKRTWRLLLKKSQNTSTTEAPTNRGLAIPTVKASSTWKSWRRLDSVQTPVGRAILIRLAVSTATPEKSRHWHGTTFSRYSPVHS